jgi:hypothetical protein
MVYVVLALSLQHTNLFADTIIFCSFDLVALIVQAIGGASAATAAQTMGNPEKV